MDKLIRPENTLSVLRKHNRRLRKRFGQNFLVDEGVVRTIMDAADLQPDDCVVEVGPGIGTLTQFLAERAGQVVAVEIDRDLVAILSETLSGYDHVTVINQDILKTDLAQIAQEYAHGRPLKVVANLPYYITTPILTQLLSLKVPLTSITVMVQKEVAERMQAWPGSKAYGSLSLAVQYYADVHLDTVVPPHCFIPHPKVESAVITLTLPSSHPVTVADEERMGGLIRAAFGQRRKTLANALSGAPALQLSREEIQQALTRLGLPEDVRGEKLTLDDFAALSDQLPQKTPSEDR